MNSTRLDMPSSLPAHPVARFLCMHLPAVNSLREYNGLAARADLVAGLSVAAVAVPQAMAYGIAAGVPAEYGLYSAIVLTAVGAIFVSSRQLIIGPTNAISIAVLSALAPVPPELKLPAAFTLTLLVGVFQTLITAFRFGDLTRFVSHSVVVGFTVGASSLLIIDQTRSLFGWLATSNAHQHFLLRNWHVWTHSGPPHQPTTAVGIGSIGLLLFMRHAKKKMGWLLFPELLVTVIAAALVVAIFRLDRAGVQVVGAIPGKMPSFAWPQIPREYLRDLAESSMAVATLGLLEALAMAKHLASQTGQPFNMNQLVLSGGLSNIAGSLFQCIPGSGSLTRSAINQQAGARTQWAGMWSAIAVGIITLLLAPYARFVPRAALAGILIVTAISMIDWKALPFHMRATHFDAFIVLTTAVAAVFISVEFCILIGVLASFVLAVPRAGRMTRTEFVVTEKGVVRERRDDEPPNDQLLIFGLEGELFFASSLSLSEHLIWFEQRADAANARVIVLRVKRLRNSDAVGMREIDDFIRHMKNRGVRVILAGVPLELLNGLKAAGALEDLDPTQVFPERQTRGSSTLEAIAAALSYLEANKADGDEPTMPAAALAQLQS